ncbi:MAG TPA: hypothetical protein VMU34_05605, partial [Mycobacterium sp.]|nr:hypothetical protein [Mycobacterium sp.]
MGVDVCSDGVSVRVVVGVAGAVVGDSVRVEVDVAVGVDVANGVDAAVVGVAPAEHPLCTLFTAFRISSTVICPSRLAWPSSQLVIASFPRAMSTIVRRSLTVTCPPPVQSPMQGSAVGVGCSVFVAMGVAGALVGLRVDDAVAVVVTVSVAGGEVDGV